MSKCFKPNKNIITTTKQKSSITFIPTVTYLPVGDIGK